MNKPNPSGHTTNGFPVARDLVPALLATSSLQPLGRAARKHSKAQVTKLASSLSEFGFVLPLLADRRRRVLHGEGLLLAAKKLELPEVPVVIIDDLSEAQARTLRLALNRLTEDASWDDAELKIELSEILQLDPEIDLQITGFETGELDVVLNGTGIEDEDELEDALAATTALTGPGDLWILGEHRVLCGDSLQGASYVALLEGESADLVVTDPPYNVPIDGHATGLGSAKHRDFAMAAGEMSPAQFEAFLAAALGLAAEHAVAGSLHYVFMDWRHMAELNAAGSAVYSELKNLCVWNKTNAGMGSLYRSQHELVFVYKKGTAPHVNNVMLGRYGRHRSNVWTYAGQNSMGGASGKGKLALHPTVKPVAMIADIIADASNRGAIVLDPFGGAGTTVIAAEKTGRRARVIEIDPGYVDLTVRRWERLTGGKAERLVTAEAPQEGTEAAA